MKKHRKTATAMLRASRSTAESVELRAGLAPSACDVSLSGEATIKIDAADGAKSLPTFQMMAYAGGPFRPKTDPPLPHPIVVDLAGVDISKQSRPALKDHDGAKLVGHTNTIQTDGKQLTASGVVSGTGDAAKEVTGAAANGFAWPVSIGASLQKIEFVKAGQTVAVNGRTVSGPVFVARASRLHEISFLTMAADDDAVATIAAEAAETGEAMSFAEWLKANGFQPESKLNAGQIAILRATFDRSKGKPLAESEKEIVEMTVQASAGTAATTIVNTDLDTVLNAARQKEATRKQIVDLTAKSIQDYPGQLDVIQAMSDQAIAGDWDAKRYELELLRATRPQVGSVRRVSREDEGMTGDVIEAALCLAGGIDKPEEHFKEPVLEAANKRWRHGLGLGELLMMFARRNGHDVGSVRSPGPLLRAAFAEDGRLMASGISSLSLPGILANTANKFLRRGFDAVESTWREIASIRPVKDFKQVSSYTLTGDFSYRKVAPGGTLEHATVGEESYTNQADTYGRMFAIDRRDIINDDLGALTQVPMRLGRGAALKFNAVFWTEFLAEHTSGATLFPTNNANLNYISGATPGTNDSRMNIEGLTRAETAFFGQLDPDGQPLGITPKKLLVPNALNAEASALMRSTEVRGTTTAGEKFGVSNPHAGKFDVVRSSYLSNSAMGGAYSSAFWYLLADPNDLSFIEVALLNGVEAPTVESADADFSQLGIQMRGYHDFGVSTQEYRAAVKSKGAA